MAFSSSTDRYTGWYKFSGKLFGNMCQTFSILIIYLTAVFKTACTRMFPTFWETIRNNMNIHEH